MTNIVSTTALLSTEVMWQRSLHSILVLFLHFWNISGLEKLLSEATLCDITIKIGSKEFPAHKNILAVSSEFFKVMFTSGLQEAESSVVSIEGDSKAFEVLLQYIYTGELKNVTEDNVTAILSMACFLNLAPHALQECKRSIIDMIDNKILSLQTAFEVFQRPEPATLRHCQGCYMVHWREVWEHNWRYRGRDIKGVFRRDLERDIKGVLRNDLGQFTKICRSYKGMCWLQCKAGHFWKFCSRVL